MSWSIRTTGTRPGVKTKILEDAKSGNIPQGVVDTIVATCDDASKGSTNGIRVEGYGHSGGGTGNIGKLEIEPVHLEGVPPLYFPGS